MDKDKFNTFEHQLFRLSQVDIKIGELKKETEEILEFFIKNFKTFNNVETVKDEAGSE